MSMHPLWKATWKVILKCTAEKSHTNATNAFILHLMQAIWGDIWKRTLEKGQTNATNVALHPHRQVIWGDIWKRTVGKKSKKCNQCDNASAGASDMRKHMNPPAISRSAPAAWAYQYDQRSPPWSALPLPSPGKELILPTQQLSATLHILSSNLCDRKLSPQQYHVKAAATMSVILVLVFTWYII